MTRRAAAKRARDEQTPTHSSNYGKGAFACSVTPSAGVLRISFELPTEVVASSPVLSAMTSMDGTDTAVQQNPACLLAWLAWHAHQHSQEPEVRRGAVASQATQWDGKVDAFNVRADPAVGRMLNLSVGRFRGGVFAVRSCWQNSTAALALQMIVAGRAARA